MGKAGIFRTLADKGLAAPNGAVLPVARAVKGKAYTFLQGMLCHNRGNMGVVVLDGKGCVGINIQGKPAAEIGRVQVANGGIYGDREEG